MLTAFQNFKDLTKLFIIPAIVLAYAASAIDIASDWYLEPTGIPQTNVGGTNTSQIQMTYEIASRTPTVRVLGIDCTSAVTAVTALLQTPAVIQGSSHLTLAVNLDIDPSSVTSSAVWNDVDSTTGMIELCVRVDLVDNSGISYNFHERTLFVTIDLTQGFTIAALDIDYAAAGTEFNPTAQTDYGLTICQCNQTSVCSIEPLAQGDTAFICVTTTDGSGIEVSSVQQLHFTQAGVIDIPVISDGVGNGWTNVVREGTNARIEAQLPSALFGAAKTGVPIVGNGVIAIRFSSDRARYLRFAIDDSVSHIIGGTSASRNMQEQTNETPAGFSVSIILVPSPSESAEPPKADANIGFIIGGTVGAIVGVAIIIIVAWLLVQRVAPRQASLIAAMQNSHHHACTHLEYR